MPIYIFKIYIFLFFLFLWIFGDIIFWYSNVAVEQVNRPHARFFLFCLCCQSSVKCYDVLAYLIAWFDRHLTLWDAATDEFRVIFFVHFWSAGLDFGFADVLDCRSLFRLIYYCFGKLLLFFCGYCCFSRLVLAALCDLMAVSSLRNSWGTYIHTYIYGGFSFIFFNESSFWYVIWWLISLSYLFHPYVILVNLGICLIFYLGQFCEYLYCIVLLSFSATMWSILLLLSFSGFAHALLAHDYVADARLVGICSIDNEGYLLGCPVQHGDAAYDLMADDSVYAIFTTSTNLLRHMEIGELMLDVCGSASELLLIPASLPCSWDGAWWVPISYPMVRRDPPRNPYYMYIYFWGEYVIATFGP